MPKYSVIIRYDTLEAFKLHGPRIEKITTDGFAAKGAINQTLFLSTRSYPPVHTTSLMVPDNVTEQDLKQVAFPEGVVVYMYLEPR